MAIRILCIIDILPWPSRSNFNFRHKMAILTFNLPVQVKGQWSKMIDDVITHPMAKLPLTSTLTFKVKLPFFHKNVDLNFTYDITKVKTPKQNESPCQIHILWTTDHKTTNLQHSLGEWRGTVDRTRSNYLV